jgi:hypothetical protein
MIYGIKFLLKPKNNFSKNRKNFLFRAREIFTHDNSLEVQEKEEKPQGILNDINEVLARAQ